MLEATVRHKWSKYTVFTVWNLLRKCGWDLSASLSPKSGSRRERFLCWVFGHKSSHWYLWQQLFLTPPQSCRLSIHPSPPSTLSLGSWVCGSCYKQTTGFSVFWEDGNLKTCALGCPSSQTELFISVFPFSSLLTTPKDCSGCCCCRFSCLAVVSLLHEAHMLNRLTCFGWPKLHKPGIEFLQLHVEINLYVALVSCKEGVLAWAGQSKQPMFFVTLGLSPRPSP